MTTSLIFADAWGFLAGLGSTVLILLCIASIFWIWAIIDAAMNPRLNGAEKVVWLLVIFFLHLLGAIVYAAIGRGTGRTLRTS
jgi:hypothetical protein